MSGDTLDSQVKKMNDTKKSILFLRILFALNFIHSKGKIHRDVKPQNILFDHNCVPFLCDFDTVKETDEKNTVDVGSLHFSSPEIIFHDQKISFASDIFSFGMILYFLCKNHNPVSTFNNYDTVGKLHKQILPGIPNHFNPINIIYEWCTSYFVDERIDSYTLLTFVIEKKMFFPETISQEITIFLNMNVKEFPLPQKITVNSSRNTLFYLNMFEKSDFIHNCNDSLNYIKEFKKIKQPEEEISCKEEGISCKEEEISCKEEEISCKEEEISYKEEEISYKEEEISYKEEEISCKEEEISCKEEEISCKEEGISCKEEEISCKEEEISCKEEGISCQEEENNFNQTLYENIQNVSNEFWYERSGSQSVLNPYIWTNFSNCMKAHKVDEALNFLNEMINIHRNPDALFLMGIIFKDPKRLLNYFEPFPLLFDIIYLLEQNTAKNIDQSIYFFEKALLGNFFYAQFEIEDIFLNTKCVNLNNSVALQLNQQLALIRTAMEYYLIGIHYFIGYGVNQNIELSIKFLSIAANHNISSAQYILGMIFFRQDDNTIDFNKKIQSISYFELASNVNPNAAFFLGNLHEYANDIPKAVIYYEKAANLIPKNINAMCFVGNIFSEKKYENLGVINYQKAFYYHKMAAQRNNPSGQFMISQYFLFGIGVAKNIQKCIQYLTLFINNPRHDILIRNSEKTSNHYKAKALISLFYLYYTGTGVPPNFSRALYYLILGAELKLPEVFSVLGYFCLHGELCPIDYEKALYYFESSKQIDGSLFHLGEMYLYGKGVVKDYLKAKYYFKLGCKHNHDYCMFSLLELYIDINDYKKQFKLCKKLISLFEQNERTNKFNYAKTLIYLGNLYENGYVIKKDIDKAVECYQKAINIGYYNAYSDIARIYQTKSSGKYNIHKCLNYLKSGSRYGCIISKYQLSVFYLEGKKVRKKTNKAINYLEQISNLSLDQDVSFDDDFFGDFYPVNFSKKRKLAPVKINPEFIKTYKIRSSTLLAMIYLFEFSKIDLALKYFCEISSFNSSALNYMGLIWYYFYKDINKAEFYFMQATQNQNIFAFINLGKLKEEKGEIKTAMKLYKYVLHHKKELIQQDIFIERKLKYILKTVNSFLLWVNLKLYLFYTKSKKESKIRKYYDAVLEMIKQNNAIHNFLYNFHSPNFADKLKNGLETIIFSYPYTMLFRYRFISHKNSYQCVNKIKYDNSDFSRGLLSPNHKESYEFIFNKPLEI